jgi:hypothetical protein
MENQVDIIKKRLFREEGTKVYAVLDGASIENLLQIFYKYEPEQLCLYQGDLEPDIAEVAPYLVRLERDTPFTDWLFETGWGNHFGIFAVAFSDLKQTRQHFRKFLTVYDSKGNPLLFRYYDPRVLRIYLPTCNEEELKQFFGTLEYLFLESEDAKSALKFRFEEGALKQEKILVTND